MASQARGLHRPIADALKKLYRRHLGRIAWLEAPPKTMARNWRGGEGFAAEEATRVEEADKLRSDLPHIEHVIRLYDPTWDPITARPLRPKSTWGARPPRGWAMAALTVLRECSEPLTIAEIVDAICERHDIELTSVAESQRAHTAVNNGLRRTHNRLLEPVGGEPMRWWLRSRGHPTESAP